LISRGLLSITGRLERPQCERKDGWFVYRGARFGEFARELQLPRDIKENEIKAHYDNGILQLQIPEPKGESRLARSTVEWLSCGWS
jgi:HSP20 family molecular chaperone IbpA